jgi:hypothetical protein
MALTVRSSRRMRLRDVVCVFSAVPIVKRVLSSLCMGFPGLCHSSSPCRRHRGSPPAGSCNPLSFDGHKRSEQTCTNRPSTPWDGEIGGINTCEPFLIMSENNTAQPYWRGQLGNTCPARASATVVILTTDETEEDQPREFRWHITRDAVMHLLLWGALEKKRTTA